MNPYASFLGDQKPLEVIAETPRRLEALLGTLGPERAGTSPAPQKWSAREIACHLADCELVFAFRFRQTLAEDHHVIQPFDQEKWAKTYEVLSAREALAVFSAVRGWNLKLLGSLPPEMFSKRATHPERGETNFRELTETMAGHDINHLRQVEQIVSRRGSPIRISA